MADYEDELVPGEVIYQGNYIKPTPLVSSAADYVWPDQSGVISQSFTTPESFVSPNSQSSQWSLYVSVTVSLGIIGVVLCCVSLLLKRFGTQKPTEMNPPLDDDNRPPSYADFLENPSLFQPTNRSCHSMMRLSSDSSSGTASVNLIPPSYESLFGEVERQESLKPSPVDRKPKSLPQGRMFRLPSWPPFKRGEPPTRTLSCLVSIPERYNYEPELKRFRKLWSIRKAKQTSSSRLSV